MSVLEIIAALIIGIVLLVLGVVCLLASLDG